MLKMLEADCVRVIQSYNKCWFFVLLCVALIMRIMYCKYQRIEMMFSDDFNDDDYPDFNVLANTTKYTTRMNLFEAELELKEMETVKKEKRYKYTNLRRKIKKINDEKIIHHENENAITAKKSSVIVIQVQTELWRLSKLIETISNARFLDNTFIIFAHDYYDRYINEMVNTVNFSEYMQIFYPFSLQLYPLTFPGDNNEFCKEEYVCEISNKRDTWLAQQKHFWWWHVNYVFENVEPLTFFDGYVLFLNYDQLISEDLIYMFRIMSQIIDTECPQCDLISLGANRPDTENIHNVTGDLFIQEYGTTDYNTGIALNITTWRLIKEHSKYFCYYNDYRWDESLKYLSNKLPRKLLMLSTAAPRVISTGCEENLQISECDSDNNMEEAISYFDYILTDLYPQKLQVKPMNHSVEINVGQEGYWEDVRDQDLCMFMVEPHFDKLQELLEF